MPGIEDYPPEQPLGVEDPSLLEGGAETRDDLRIRLWRESAPAPSEETGIRLEADTGNDPAEDSTGTAIAERASTTASPSAEEAAVDIVGEPGEDRDR